VLLIQGSAGIGLGLLLLFVVFEQVKLEWFLSLAALQAVSTGIGEIVVARHAPTHAVSIWNYAAGAVALVAAIAYAVVRIGFAYALQQRQISWLVYAYLVAFGVALCLTAARMIYADREAFLHPSAPRA